MELLQQKALDQFVALYRAKAEFLAILLAGSLVHGYAKADSDIDIILVVSDQAYAKRQAENQLAFSIWDICEYAGGYIDCKVTCRTALGDIARSGSDAARYAFQGVRILFDRTDGLSGVLAEVCRFPQDQKANRQHRFVCQLLAWKWYLSQAENKQNQYLLHMSAFKIGLFASRIVLNHNEMLFPYHKWLAEEVRKARHKPAGFDAALQDFFAKPTFDQAQTISDRLLGLLGLVEKTVDWPNQFMIDSELNWLHQDPPIDDL